MGYDLILAGGGLANGLLAYRLRQRRPSLRVLLLERGATLGGNHTWSFFASDLDSAQLRWLAPFVERHWRGYRVAFPARQRMITTPYLSFTSRRFHQVLMDALGEQVRLTTSVTAMDGHGVTLAGGERLQAQAVADGRGPAASPRLMLGHQTFVGEVVTLHREHRLPLPLLMDATVPQQGGFRFFYTLPLGPRELLIEETRYRQDPILDPAAASLAIADYAQRRGWNIAAVQRQEQGVLPVALAGDMEALWEDAGNVTLTGLRGGLFHNTTGYSLPEAVRLADRVALLDDLNGPALRRAIAGHALEHWRRQRFYRLLNRMMLEAASPELRYRVFQRFYGLPQPLIERFYAGRLTPLDKLRLLSGRPPVPLHRALRVLRARRAGDTADRPSGDRQLS